MEIRRVVGAALVDSLARPTRVLACRRTEPPALAGGWEFPGGKVEPGEDDAAALHREIREELGTRIVLGDLVRGPREDGRWQLGERHAMFVWLAELDAAAPAPTPLEDHDELRWLGRDELRDVPWLPADVPILVPIEKLLRRGLCPSSSRSAHGPQGTATH